AVSVGEVRVLAPLIDRLAEAGDVDLVISSTTRTGLELARRQYGRHHVIPFPLDFSWSVRRAFDRIRPDLVVLAELELWPNFLRRADRLGIPVALINGRLSDRSFRGYRRLRWVLAPTFGRLALVAAQSTRDARRFGQLGIPPGRIAVTGSLKFDGAPPGRNMPETAALAKWARLDENDVVFCAGSTQEGEEAMALAVFQKLRGRFDRLRLLLVPRHPERFERVARLLEASGIPWARRSCDPDGGKPVVLVDTVGELRAWWGTAAIAYVGGTMGPREGQNMIEPAACGAATCFGPRTGNFRDVVAQLRSADAAVVVKDQDELERFVRRCLEDPSYACELGRRARDVVERNRGAAEKTLAALGPLLPTGRTGETRIDPSARKHPPVRALPGRGATESFC
ncbi:MAG TPA: 3-deoxy-D-manno-octulosonic acid transferase, partial [Bryobacterales bacterium]|nr:3-deoxy-D-manno-octulosonic acid transferase [Bryobacterales bacterium]